MRGNEWKMFVLLYAGVLFFWSVTISFSSFLFPFRFCLFCFVFHRSSFYSTSRLRTLCLLFLPSPPPLSLSQILNMPNLWVKFLTTTTTTTLSSLALKARFLSLFSDRSLLFLCLELWIVMSLACLVSFRLGSFACYFVGNGAWQTIGPHSISCSLFYSAHIPRFMKKGNGQIKGNLKSDRASKSKKGGRFGNPYR
jgi:hypothetical protein